MKIKGKCFGIKIFKRGEARLGKLKMFNFLKSEQFDKIELNMYHEFSNNNTYLLYGDKWLCTCFHCESIFTSNLIVETAGTCCLCPSCKVDSVIPIVRITDKKTNNEWMNKTIKSLIQLNKEMCDFWFNYCTIYDNKGNILFKGKLSEYVKKHKNNS